MTLNDMIKILRSKCEIEIRDHDNYRICKTSSDSKGVIPYLNYEIKEWFPSIERVHKERYTSENAYNVAIRKERAKDCKLIDGILKEWKNRKFIKNYVKEGQGEDTIFVFDVANSKMIEDVGALEN